VQTEFFSKLLDPDREEKPYHGVENAALPKIRVFQRIAINKLLDAVSAEGE
jgi:hypothetical protein